MKKKIRKIHCVLLVVGVLLLVLLGRMLYIKIHENNEMKESKIVEIREDGIEKNTQKKPEDEKETKKQNVQFSQRPAPEFYAFELLDSVLTPEQVKGLKEQMTEKIVGSTLYESVTKVTCKDTVIDLGDTIEFYCELNDKERTVFHIVFEKEEELFSVTKEKIPAEVLDQERKESENFLQQEPYEATKENEEKLPVPWENVEPDIHRFQLVGWKL